MKLKHLITTALLFCAFLSARSQTTEQKNTEYKHFLGSTAFILMTPILDPSPKYFQVNYGYRITPKDVISVEAITWTYTGPLGRQYGPHYENSESDFPGAVRAVGAGLAYKRFLWKELYAQFHSTALHQTYLDEDDKKIGSGFQLFNSLRIGYHLSMFKNRFFLEPSVAVTNWPINTGLPESFQVEEDKWPKYFLFEPGLQFGINF